MVRTLLGQKKSMRQVWSATGRRMPVTEISVAGNAVTRVVTVPGEGEEGSTRVQIGFGIKKLKNLNNAQRQQLAKSGIEVGKRWFRETESLNSEQPVQAGQDLPIQEVFHVGDVIKVSGTIKGRGFAGVVKRHNFKGGPKTHGQSDRQRAPGSIGNRTSPGRVFPGKRMPGHYGVTTETLENRVIVAMNPETQTIWVKGTLPGSFNGLLTLEKQDGQKEIALNQSSLEILGLAPVQAAPAEGVAAIVDTEVEAAVETQASEAAPEIAAEASEESIK